MDGAHWPRAAAAGGNGDDLAAAEAADNAELAVLLGALGDLAARIAAVRARIAARQGRTSTPPAAPQPARRRADQW
jgi:hypothetical protein